MKRNDKNSLEQKVLYYIIEIYKEIYVGSLKHGRGL